MTERNRRNPLAGRVVAFWICLIVLVGAAARSRAQTEDGATLILAGFPSL